MEDLQENLTNPENVVVIEWGESVTDILPREHLKVEIIYNDDGTREVMVQDSDLQMERDVNEKDRNG